MEVSNSAKKKQNLTNTTTSESNVSMKTFYKNYHSYTRERTKSDENIRTNCIQAQKYSCFSNIVRIASVMRLNLYQL